MKKHILITGVSTGIGYGCAHYFVNKGYHVFGSVRRQSDADSCQASLGELFTPLLFDVRDKAAIEASTQKVRYMLKGQNLTALINNAGIAISGPLQFVKEESLQAQFDINVIGLIKVTQVFLPFLGATIDNTATPGRLINISSVASQITTPMQIAYCASKYAVESITDGWRRELALYGIKVISIRPGPIQSAIWQKAKEDHIDLQGTRYEQIWKYKNTRIEKAEAEAIPVKKVAKAIEKAITKRNPRMRYLVYRKPILFNFVRLLPDRILDSIFARQLAKIDTTKKRGTT